MPVSGVAHTKYNNTDELTVIGTKVFLLLPESQRMQFLANNMSARELRRWIAHRLKLFQSSGTKAEGTGQPGNTEKRRRELAFMCRHIMSMERSKARNGAGGWLPRLDDPTFSSVLEQLVIATLMARQVRLFGSAVRKCPSKLSRAMWFKVGEEFKDDDVLHGGYKDR